MSVPSLKQLTIKKLPRDTLPILEPTIQSDMNREMGAPLSICIYKMPLLPIARDVYEDIVKRNANIQEMETPINDYTMSPARLGFSVLSDEEKEDLLNLRYENYAETVEKNNLMDWREPKEKYTEHRIDFVSLMNDITIPWPDIERKYGILEPGLGTTEGSYDEDVCVWPKALWVAYETNRYVRSDPNANIIREYKHFNKMSLHILAEDGY